jgi:hypothetical protein
LSFLKTEKITKVEESLRLSKVETPKSGEINLPNCPTLAYSFGIEPVEIVYSSPSMTQRADNTRMVLAKFEKPKPLWLVDRTDYDMEYEKRLTNKESGTIENRYLHEWIQSSPLFN